MRLSIDGEDLLGLCWGRVGVGVYIGTRARGLVLN